MFRYFSCKFRIEKYKESCARIALWRDFNIYNSYTIEASVYGYFNHDRETISFTPQLLDKFGECFGNSLFEYLLILEEDRRYKLELAKKLQQQRKTKRKTISEILGTFYNMREDGVEYSKELSVLNNEDEGNEGGDDEDLN